MQSAGGERPAASATSARREAIRKGDNEHADSRPVPGPRFDARTRKRVGRGHGSGHGGRRARRQGPELPRRRHQGPRVRGWPDPAAMRLPKLPGFKNRNRVEYAIVNVVASRGALRRRATSSTPSALIAKGVIKSARLRRSRCSATASSPRSSPSRSTRSPDPRRRRSRQPEGRSRRRAQRYRQCVPRTGASQEDPLHARDHRAVPPRAPTFPCRVSTSRRSSGSS